MYPLNRMLSLAVVCLFGGTQTPGIPTLNELYKNMSDAIRRERGYEDEVSVFTDGKEAMKFSRSVDAGRFKFRQWRGDQNYYESGYDGDVYYAIDHIRKSYWNYARKKSELFTAFKTVEFKKVGPPSASLRYEGPFDIWAEVHPNPRVVSVKDTELDDQPARVVKLLFSEEGGASQEASFYFEKDRWILLRAEATTLAENGYQTLVAIFKIKRGVVFDPSAFRLDIKNVTGFTKKAKDG